MEELFLIEAGDLKEIQKDQMSVPKLQGKNKTQRQPIWSSGVPFYPPSSKYWRIGRKWYDFTSFLPKHPGGQQILLLARDRYEDATFLFEAHHNDYQKARKIIKKYEVPESLAQKSLEARPQRGDSNLYSRTHFDYCLDKGLYPKLADDNSFYCVLRQRVTNYLQDIGYSSGGPTYGCLFVFWTVFFVWFVLMYLTWLQGEISLALLSSLFGSWLGAFGHNWVHQPRYKKWGWAVLSLDVLGFNSETWFRDHTIQHHMYTNTPWDNHFRGTEPFLITNPTVKRSFLYAYIMPFINPLILCFGIYGNYVTNTIEILKGNEMLTTGKIFLPLHFYLMISRWGYANGIQLTFIFHALCGVYYFTCALMNHNTLTCQNMETRNASKDWGHAQLNSSADWGINMSFYSSFVYLCLNYHTVHHLFPRVDFSHYPAIQLILMKTCREFGIQYQTASVFTIYKEMIHTFASPTSLMKDIIVFSGAI